MHGLDENLSTIRSIIRFATGAFCYELTSLAADGSFLAGAAIVSL
jgi:hypothetical protein